MQYKQVESFNGLEITLIPHPKYLKTIPQRFVPDDVLFEGCVCDIPMTIQTKMFEKRQYDGRHYEYLSENGEWVKEINTVRNELFTETWCIIGTSTMEKFNLI